MRSDNRVVNFGDTHATTHLSDDQLMETYVLAGDNRHLAVCRPCKTRFDDLVRSLQRMHEAAVVDADSAFTAERLHDQHDRIMRRIERHDHPAEVVAFPHQRVPSHHPAVHRLLGPARRWVAGAAAAGLAAGVFLGFAMDRSHLEAIDRTIQQSKSDTPLALQATADDQFFIDIDEALIGSRVREMRPALGAIDLMTTPLEIREVSYVRE
jgi:hypothetical protein